MLESFTWEECADVRDSRFRPCETTFPQLEELDRRMYVGSVIRALDPWSSNECQAG